MQGYVNDNCEAVVSLVVSNGTTLKSIKALIDTGFTGFLSLLTAVLLYKKIFKASIRKS